MNASRDENSVPTMIGASSEDGQTLIRVKANPATGGIKAIDGTGNPDNGPGDIDLRDENNVPALVAVSEDDGITPVVLYTDPDGNLLIDSN